MQTLDDLRRDAEERLREAGSNRGAQMHTPVVVTADADARIMVLREFDAEGWLLRFHTDARAPKVAVIEAQPDVAVLFYDKQAGVQLRCRGRARIERDGPIADAAWSSSDNYARRCYLGAAPGEEADGPTSGLPEWIEGEKPTDAQLEPARAHFAVLLVEVDAIDCYHLAHGGHRRALVRRPGAEDGGGHWLTP